VYTSDVVWSLYKSVEVLINNKKVVCVLLEESHKILTIFFGIGSKGGLSLGSSNLLFLYMHNFK